MAKRIWTVEAADGTHRIELEHNYVWGHRVIRVDQQVVYQSGARLFDKGSSHQIQIGDQTGRIEITSNGFSFRYDLIFNDRSVTTGEMVAERAPAPPWAWLFVIACGALVPLGGAIGAVLGLAGARLCYRISQNAERTVGARVLQSVGVTAGAWIAWMVLGTVLAVLLRRA